MGLIKKEDDKIVFPDGIINTEEAYKTFSSFVSVGVRTSTIRSLFQIAFRYDMTLKELRTLRYDEGKKRFYYIPETEGKKSEVMIRGNQGITVSHDKAYRMLEIIEKCSRLNEELPRTEIPSMPNGDNINEALEELRKQISELSTLLTLEQRRALTEQVDKLENLIIDGPNR